MSQEEQPKIIIDDDWKHQAQKEKEELSAHSDEALADVDGPLPPPSFSSLVQMMATQILLYLGDVPNPMTGQTTKNLDLAKHQIDMLQMVEEKTKGNLTDDEKQLLDTALYEVRMRFVNAASSTNM
jgi:hypothetical protein